MARSHRLLTVLGLLLALALSTALVEAHAAPHDLGANAAASRLLVTPHHTHATGHLEAWNGTLEVECPACLLSLHQRLAATSPHRLVTPRGHRPGAVAGSRHVPSLRQRLPVSRGPPAA